jgi:hypothetical protein
VWGGGEVSEPLGLFCDHGDMMNGIRIWCSWRVDDVRTRGVQTLLMARTGD